MLDHDAVILSARPLETGEFEVVRFIPGRLQDALREVYSVDPARLVVVKTLEQRGRVEGDSIRWTGTAT